MIIVANDDNSDDDYDDDDYDDDDGDDDDDENIEYDEYSTQGVQQWFAPSADMHPQVSNCKA